MPDPNVKPRQEAKRLNKSVKRRRAYADNLRSSAKEQLALGDEDFADKLDRLADRELELARSEAAQAKDLETRPPITVSPYFRDAHSEARSAAAMEALKGRLAVDRIRHLAEQVGVDAAQYDNNETMARIEKHLEIFEEAHPIGAPRLQLGRRIALAETKLYGAPRF